MGEQKNSSQTKKIYYVIVWSHRTSAASASGKWKYFCERNIAIKEECSSPTHKYFQYFVFLWMRQRNIVKLCDIATCYNPIKIIINNAFDHEIFTDAYPISSSLFFHVSVKNILREVVYHWWKIVKIFRWKTFRFAKKKSLF